MSMVSIIEKKRGGAELTGDEIREFVHGYHEGAIPDYQASALLMAVCFRGMTARETTALALEMAATGGRIDLSGVSGVKVDKHSSGGVGDKTTLAVAPWAAACGLKVAKMSGRGLGFTGGTIDKLESIRGFRTALGKDEFIRQVNSIGFALTGQTEDVAPVDKKLYALRDVTATVDSLPLIASSIMSKKLACDSDAIVLDVKAGSGAFMHSLDGAVALARQMAGIGAGAGRRVIAAVTQMDEPLGYAVGNALEVAEAVHTLRGEGPADFTELCMVIAEQMLLAGGIYQKPNEARSALEHALETGAAYRKFVEFVAAQGGDLSQIEDTSLLPQAAFRLDVAAAGSGHVAAIDAMLVGKAANLAGAGRETKEDSIDHAAGIVLRKKTGDRVEKGEALCTVHAATEAKARAAAGSVLRAYEFGAPRGRPPMLRALITAEGEKIYG